MRASITLTEEKSVPTIHLDFLMKSLPAIEYQASWTYLGCREEHLYQLREVYRVTDRFLSRMRDRNDRLADFHCYFGGPEARQPSG
jgi:hypothetical protein